MKKVACMLLLLVEFALGGTTGKIAGRVTDASTGERLPGVNITVDGTQIGAVTDPNGNYFIINLPVGEYTVRVSLVGYAPKGVSGVRVIVDMTTTIDFSLSSKEIQADEVIVSASRPAIQQDRTSTKHTIERDMIDALPVDDFRAVVQVQAGVEGSHFRGGRFNESLFMVDGVQVKSPVNGYTGYTGGFSASIPQINVDEVQVSTGGFEAEYGNAQSGVVNTLTRGPSGAFSAKLRARTSDFPWAKMQLKPNEYGSGQPDWKSYEGFFASPYVFAGDLKLGMTASADISWQTRSFLTHENFNRESYQGKILAATGESKFNISGLYSTSTVNDYYHRYSAFGPLSQGYQFDHYERVAGTTSNPILERYIFVADPRGTPAPVVRTVTDSILFNGTKYGQVRDIYQGKIKNWKELGGPDAPIVAISRDTSSGTYEGFHEMVMKKQDMAPGIEQVNANPQMHARVSSTVGAIGYVGMGFVDAKVKAVKFDGVEPKRDTILNGTYPLSRPLFLFTNGYPKLGSTIHKFVTFYLTEKGQELIEAKGFVPITKY